MTTTASLTFIPIGYFPLCHVRSRSATTLHHGDGWSNRLWGAKFACEVSRARGGSWSKIQMLAAAWLVTKHALGETKPAGRTQGVWTDCLPSHLILKAEAPATLLAPCNAKEAPSTLPLLLSALLPRAIENYPYFIAFHADLHVDGRVTYHRRWIGVTIALWVYAEKRVESVKVLFFHVGDTVDSQVLELVELLHSSHYPARGQSCASWDVKLQICTNIYLFKGGKERNSKAICFFLLLLEQLGFQAQKNASKHPFYVSVIVNWDIQRFLCLNYSERTSYICIISWAPSKRNSRNPPTQNTFL